MEDLSTGAAILGTGGGGDPYLGKLMALSVLEKGMKIEVIPPEDVPDDALIIPSAAARARVEIEEIALPYLPGNAVRVRVKAAGDLIL